MKTAQSDTIPDTSEESKDTTEEVKETQVVDDKKTPVKDDIDKPEASTEEEKEDAVVPAEEKEVVTEENEREVEKVAETSKEEVTGHSEAETRPHEMGSTLGVKNPKGSFTNVQDDSNEKNTPKEETIDEAKDTKEEESVEPKEKKTETEKEKEVKEKLEAEDEILDIPPKKKSFFFSDVPAVDMNAPLKSDDSEENDDLPAIEKSNKKLFVLGTTVFVATVIVTGIAGFFILNGYSGEKKAVEPKEEKAVVATPTPVVVIKKEEWTFEVLNGSGVAGAAAKASEKLTALGYKVVKTGNADNDATGNQLSVVASKKDEAKAIVEDLKKDFGDITIGETLTTDSKAVARLVIGK